MLIILQAFIYIEKTKKDVSALFMILRKSWKTFFILQVFNISNIYHFHVKTIEMQSSIPLLFWILPKFQIYDHFFLQI